MNERSTYYIYTCLFKTELSIQSITSGVKLKVLLIWSMTLSLAFTSTLPTVKLPEKQKTFKFIQHSLLSTFIL